MASAAGAGNGGGASLVRRAQGDGCVGVEDSVSGKSTRRPTGFAARQVGVGLHINQDTKFVIYTAPPPHSTSRVLVCGADWCNPARPGSNKDRLRRHWCWATARSCIAPTCLFQSLRRIGLAARDMELNAAMRLIARIRKSSRDHHAKIIKEIITSARVKPSRRLPGACSAKHRLQILPMTESKQYRTMIAARSPCTKPGGKPDTKRHNLGRGSMPAFLHYATLAIALHGQCGWGCRL